ncbi:MAG TPA: 30S ribosomal protein S13 [Candidatus Omnitrophica bacterium]|nr:30S ribosomal protein S13 [Candidatus Omnitrophota bacterium]
MARVIGVEIPDKKKVRIALTYIYGIGMTNSLFVLKSAGVDPEKRVKNLSGEELSKIASVIQTNLKVEGALRQDVSNSIRQLIEIGSYRGLRHRMGLPVRGQRTSSNARTRKGPRKTVGILRKKVRERLGEKKR